MEKFRKEINFKILLIAGISSLLTNRVYSLPISNNSNILRVPCAQEDTRERMLQVMQQRGGTGDSVNKLPAKANLKDLKKQFSEKFAAELLEETARLLREAEEMPKNYSELKRYKGKISTLRIREIEGKMRISIWDRVFRTYLYRQLESELERYLIGEIEMKKAEALSRFDGEFRDILHKHPLSEEEQEMYLSESAMTDMGWDDYLILLERLSGQFLTHVTRFGIREQTFMFHYAGEGEFLYSFIEILKAKRLYPFLSNVQNEGTFLISMLRKQIKDYINEGRLIKTEEILDAIDPPGYKHPLSADQDSVHFAMNQMGASLYGGEKGYDIYFYFPAEFIAHNYYHLEGTGGNLDFDRWGNYFDKHNDVLVWNEGKGIPIDAGVVHIPANAMVDPETGSQYKTIDGIPERDKEGNLIPAENTIRSQDFWDDYFIKHPEQKPSKVVYYSFISFPYSGRLSDSNRAAYLKLFQKRQFSEDSNRMATIPDYERYIKEARVQFRNKLRELVYLVKKELSDEVESPIVASRLEEFVSGANKELRSGI